jgi:hypothetical protein
VIEIFVAPENEQHNHFSYTVDFRYKWIRLRKSSQVGLTALFFFHLWYLCGEDVRERFDNCIYVIYNIYNII